MLTVVNLDTQEALFYTNSFIKAKEFLLKRTDKRDCVILGENEEIIYDYAEKESSGE